VEAAPLPVEPPKPASAPTAATAIVGQDRMAELRKANEARRAARKAAKV
jgi:hypothetical protein